MSLETRFYMYGFIIGAILSGGITFAVMSDLYKRALNGWVIQIELTDEVIDEANKTLEACADYHLSGGKFF